VRTCSHGEARSVDTAKRTATIQHEAVHSLNGPAMTMAFKASDASTLQQLNPGAEVKFEFQQRGKEYIVTASMPRGDRARRIAG
jgi:Cu/Ag efflux protein CusF